MYHSLGELDAIDSFFRGLDPEIISRIGFLMRIYRGSCQASGF